MLIREAAPADAEAIYQIVKSTGGSMPWVDADECRQHIEWMIGLGVTPIVAEVRGRVVGELEAWWGEDVPEIGYSLDISTIDVHEDYQQQGIGRALMQWAFETAQDRGCERISVWGATDAMGFYRKLGFNEDLVISHYAVTPTSLRKVPGIEFVPVKLADLEPPKGPYLLTGRILHPRQRWHDFLSEEPVQRRWKDTAECQSSIAARVIRAPGTAEPGVVVYRRYHWLRDAATAELHLWNPVRSRAVLEASIAHVTSLGITKLSVLAYGEVTGLLSSLGCEVVGEDKVLVRTIQSVSGVP